jgi:hypothetical protein
MMNTGLRFVDDSYRDLMGERDELVTADTIVFEFDHAKAVRQQAS